LCHTGCDHGTADDIAHMNPLLQTWQFSKLLKNYDKCYMPSCLPSNTFATEHEYLPCVKFGNRKTAIKILSNAYILFHANQLEQKSNHNCEKRTENQIVIDTN
jgi:hypothetical protein